MLVRLIVVLVFLGLLLGGIFYLKQQQMQQQAAMGGPPPPPVVAAAQVQLEDWRPRLQAVGSLVATQGIFVTNEVSGQVSEIHFESGGAVARGDLLVQLDDSVDQADLRGLLAQRDLAQIKLGRFGKLLKDRSASQSDYDEAKAELDSAEAAVASKQALIAKKRITAPFDGILGIRIVDVGEFLPPGSQIVPLDALEPIYADYSLPERHLPQIAVGEEVLVRVSAHSQRAFQGTIAAINPGVEERTRSVKVRAVLENTERLLRPGMFAEVATLLPVRQGLLTVPRTAISFAPYGDTVFVLLEQGEGITVERRQVTTGESRGGRVEIREGLAAGDRVVIAGQVKLRNGQAVTIDNSVVPPAGGPLGP
jgi:membrane fusion protein (multidrug efflux system)